MDIFDLKYDPTKSEIVNLKQHYLLWGHPDESLADHILKTKYSFSHLINEDILLYFYNHFIEKEYISISHDSFLNVLESMIDFHDSGKISFNFQINKLNNFNIKNMLVNYNWIDLLELITSNHSQTSSLLHFQHLVDNINLNDNIILLLCSYVIYGHHTSIKDILNQSKFAWDLDEIIEESFLLFASYYGFDVDTVNEHKYFQEKLYYFLNESNDTAISFFYSYIYSILIKSDVIASSCSKNTVEDTHDIILKRWNKRVIDSLFEKMKNAFYDIDFNKDSRDISFTFDETIQNVSNINDLRNMMLNESSYYLIQSLVSNPDKKIFFLNLPTGGGKTNTSMKLSLDILEHTLANRIIYAMPFINIIEQNHESIIKSWNLSEDLTEVRKIYSASETIFDNRTDDFKSEIINRDNFFDYPIMTTTFVTFFNSIIKNKKKYKHSLSAFENSVVILDEIQSLPLKNWTSLYFLLNELSNNFNIYFIIMSATLPDFDNLNFNKGDKFDYENLNLIPNSKKYFNHSFFDRTEIKGNIKNLDLADEEEILTFFKDILNENYTKNYYKGLIVLNTVKTSKIVYEYFLKLKKDDNDNNFNFKIDLLNSSVLPAVKKRIIHKINNLKNMHDKYILVSTQSVEAGVDVSFDFVIRDFAILDSIEQIRGRCNRNRELNAHNEKLKGNVYLTKIKTNDKFDYKRIYGKEEINTRIFETENILKNNINYGYGDLIKYYKAVTKQVNLIQEDKENNSIYHDGDNIEYWNKCRYDKLQDKNYGINLIQNNIKKCSFFVATNMNILLNEELKIEKTFEEMDIDFLNKFFENHSENEFVFTLKEITYLKNQEKDSNYNLIIDNNVNGFDLIKFYEFKLDEVKNEINLKKIIEKEFSSILYKFIFQVGVINCEELAITQNLDPLGYFFIIPPDKIGEKISNIYSTNTGFNFKIQEDDNVIL